MAYKSIYLKPCPFCGSEDVKISKNERELPFLLVCCVECGASTTKLIYWNDETEKDEVIEAVNLWNRRVNNG